MSRHDDQPEARAGVDESPGPARGRPVTVTVIEYDGSRFNEQTCTRPGDLRALILRPTVTWINADGVHDIGMVQAIGDAVGIHPLTLEDIANTRQRPKIEDYRDYLYVAVRMLAPDGDGEFRSEQVSLVLGRGYVVSFQEQPGDAFEHIRERLRAGAGRLRSEGADYLFYALLDAIVDGYFSVIEVFGERIEAVEEEVVAEPDRETLQAIYALKRSLVALRRSVWPLRDVVAELERGDSPLIREPTLFYLRDVYDHTIEVAETVETYRDTMSGILDVYLSSQSSRMNEIIKVLTIIATIFIPLTFIAGVYGMNFAYMPEIRHPWGYPAALASMAVVAAMMLLYFRKKGWI
ncbi:magnesium/cobalt transporter CorA [Methanoculleus oceani]|uniref:Magnesium transport protein CorA n=1 Tax=Methanoculleus oceani TaxID=2184756 RepID=A0ABD4TGJ6_9EURY|nr:magnesium/cobalt transporter CorA [Methanoculleus sp. CWC-02]MCM2466988.1 magnesium and cobalt transport protein CorA [Methanoculleus sp. CWC-02]